MFDERDAYVMFHDITDDALAEDVAEAIAAAEGLDAKVDALGVILKRTDEEGGYE